MENGVRELTDADLELVEMKPGDLEEKPKVQTHFNEDGSAALAKFSSTGNTGKHDVTAVLDFSNCTDEFLRKLAADQAKIKAQRYTSRMVDEGIRGFYIPVTEEVLEPGRGEFTRAPSMEKLSDLLRKHNEGSATDEELKILEDNAPAIAEFRERLLASA